MLMGMWQEMPILNTLMTAEGGNVVSGTKLTLRGLLFTDDKGAFEGELAEQVPSIQNGGISADGKNVTFKLRKGVTWHDGKPVTSADVRYTWEAVMKPDNKVGTRYGYENITAVDTPDEQTAIVRLRSVRLLGDPFDIIMPKHVIGAEPTSTGSKFHQQPGRIRAVQDYREHQGRPHHLRGVRMATGKAARRSTSRSSRFGSADAMVQALKAKEVDLTWSTPLPNILVPALEGQGITTSCSQHRRRALRLQRRPHPGAARRHRSSGRPSRSPSIARPSSTSPVRPDHHCSVATGQHAPGRISSSSPSSTTPTRRKAPSTSSAGSPTDGIRVRTARSSFVNTTTSARSSRERAASDQQESRTSARI
jgi:hypothetical protein